MRIVSSILAGMLLSATPFLIQSTLAHETAGRNGGRVTDAGAYHVELVARSGSVDVYLMDGGEKPVPASGVKGVAILITSGKPARIPLEPADGNRLTGTTPTTLPQNPKGAVRLTMPDGRSASASFN